MVEAVQRQLGDRTDERGDAVSVHGRDSAQIAGDGFARLASVG